MKTAILLGATGLTGGLLLKRLLQDNRYSKIKLFSRNSTGIDHPKIEEYLIDLFRLEDYRDDFIGDEVFVCIGTTKKKTPDETLYKKVDYGIPVTAARLAAQNGITSFLVVSALGADAGSRFFYNRIKGEMERDVAKEAIKGTYFFHPSLITGERQESRFFEGLGEGIMKLVNPLLRGGLRRYRSIRSQTIAEAMVYVANEGYFKSIIPSDEIKQIASTSKNK